MAALWAEIPRFQHPPLTAIARERPSGTVVDVDVGSGDTLIVDGMKWALEASSAFRR